jgi:hypothetical protein
LKELKKIPYVFEIAAFAEQFVIFTSNTELKLLPNVFIISLEELYLAKSSENCIIYQTRKSGVVFLLSKDLSISEFKGTYGILNAFSYRNGFIVTNVKSRTYHYIERKLRESQDLKYYFNKSGKLNEEYLFKRLGDEITLFTLSQKEVSLTFDIPKDFGFDASPVEGIFNLESTIYIPLSNGQLMAVDITTRKLIWKQERVGKVRIYEEKIYCIADYTIKELDAKTGKIIREKSMQNLVESYNFKPTGEHKVYDDCIFLMSTGKPGRVAIYDRKSLDFLELIEIDEMIPVGQNHVHWHNNRLYILDFVKNLHIYERE